MKWPLLAGLWLVLPSAPHSASAAEPAAAKRTRQPSAALKERRAATSARLAATKKDKLSDKSAAMRKAAAEGAQAGEKSAAAPEAPADGESAEDREFPGAKGALPNTMDTIAQAAQSPYEPKPGSHLVKFNLEDADLAELVNHISGLTGKRFIFGAKTRQIKVTVVSPQPVTLDEAYEAFLSILEANGMTVVPHGRFMKIIDSAGVMSRPTPVYGRGAPVPDSDRFITRLYRLQHADPAEVSALLTKFKSKDGDISLYQPGSLLILTDTGVSIRRMVRLIDEIDVGGVSSRMWIEPIHYGSAGDMAKQINDIFELSKGDGDFGGLTRVVAEEQTNSLIIVGAEDAYLRLLELLRRIDVAPAAHGRVHVLSLQHSVAEELAQTLTQMLTGAAPQPRSGGGGRQQAAAAAATATGDATGAGQFEGEVRVTADRATNSLIVTSSAHDFAQLRLVIEKLDARRRQVFIEAVIMDMNVDRNSSVGVSFHGGATANVGGSTEESLILGGFNALGSIQPNGPDATVLAGAALGIRGPDIDGPGLPGLSIPAFGVFLNALVQTGDSNVLSTPHIIATDNVQAEINVGRNIPLQTNVAGGFGNLAGLAGLAGGAGAAAAAAPSNLAGLSSLGGFGFNAPRQDVGTRIRITPHINRENQVRLEIEEEISEEGATVGTLGAVSITQRSARTTVVVDDQQTIVIGGLMRESEREEADKVPLLGDIPVLGFLFRNTRKAKSKSNLILILTPYVIEDQSDLRRVFERKMQERQEFIDRYFVFSADWEPPRDYAKTIGLVEEIRHTFVDLEERRRLGLELIPSEERTHEPGEAIELPQPVKLKGGPGAPTTAPKPKTRPKTAPKRTERDDGRPLQITPIARSVNVGNPELGLDVEPEEPLAERAAAAE